MKPKLVLFSFHSPPLLLGTHASAGRVRPDDGLHTHAASGGPVVAPPASQVTCMLSCFAACLLRTTVVSTRGSSRNAPLLSFCVLANNIGLDAAASTAKHNRKCVWNLGGWGAWHQRQHCAFLLLHLFLCDLGVALNTLATALMAAAEPLK
jgi:hypothetical protein